MDALDFFHFVLSSFVNNLFRSFFSIIQKNDFVYSQNYSSWIFFVRFLSISLLRKIARAFSQIIFFKFVQTIYFSLFFVCFENDCFFITLNDSFFSWTTPSFTKNFVFSQKKFVHNNEAHLYKEDKGGGICFLLF